MTITVGTRIEHKYLPGFRMTVLDVRNCETPDHQAFQVRDPDGNLDWLCAHDVHETVVTE